MKTKKEVICWIVLALLQLIWIIPMGIKMDKQAASHEVVKSEVSEMEEDILLKPEVETVIKDFVSAPEEIETGTEENETFLTETETEESETETVEPEEEFISLSYIPEYIQRLCFEIGEEYHIAPELLIAIIESESGGDVNAKNKSSGCMGLMQLHPKYADYYMKKAGVSDPYNAEHNIRTGCEILIEKFEEYGDLPIVLMKYHGESKALQNYHSGNYSAYCIKIMERMDEMQTITGG